MPTKKVATQLSVAIILCATQILASAAPIDGKTPQPKKICKEVDIPAVICPPGQHLLSPGNTCHGGFIKKTVCRNAAASLHRGTIHRPSAPTSQKAR